MSIDTDEIPQYSRLLQSWQHGPRRPSDGVTPEPAMYNMDVGLELERHFLLDNHSYSSASSSELFLCDDDSNLSDCSSYSYSSDQEGGPGGQCLFVIKRYFTRTSCRNGCPLRNGREMNTLYATVM